MNNYGLNGTSNKIYYLLLLTDLLYFRFVGWSVCSYQDKTIDIRTGVSSYQTDEAADRVTYIRF